uniref:Uncharacterized protein n=1 Tax=Arundo donax TaxID=35708 RepID=A0A0A9FJ48_ARUDO
MDTKKLILHQSKMIPCNVQDNTISLYAEYIELKSHSEGHGE